MTLWRHKCHFVPIAARPAAEIPETAGPFTSTKGFTGTLILARCGCGGLTNFVLMGTWTSAELGVPCGDAEAVDALLDE
jgi:hypothetical protein